MNEGPYRTPAEMPEKEEVMSDDVRIWKLVVTGFVSIAGLIVMCVGFNTIHNDQTELAKIQIQSTETAAIAAQARAAEAKALSDKAMFEEMAKHPK